MSYFIGEAHTPRCPSPFHAVFMSQSISSQSLFAPGPLTEDHNLISKRFLGKGVSDLLSNIPDPISSPSSIRWRLYMQSANSSADSKLFFCHVHRHRLH